MTRPDDLFGDMPALPPIFEPTRDDDDLAALMAGADLPVDAPVETRLVADLFLALTGPGSAEEIAGLDAARRAFLAQRPVAVRPGPHRLGRRTSAGIASRRPRGRGRLVAASVIGVLGLGGFAGAAFAGVLPDAMQRVAHRLVGAPSPEPTVHGAAHSSAAQHPAPSNSTGASAGRSTGPDATGPAAAGLCTAYDRSRTGDAGQRSAYEHSRAYQQLVVAAGGQDQVSIYCTTVPRPSADAPGTSHAGGHPSGPASGGSGSTEGRPGDTGRPSAALSHPAHPSHPESSAAPTSDAPSSTPVSGPVAPGHPSKTRTPTKGPRSPQTKGVGSTRSPR